MAKSKAKEKRLTSEKAISILINKMTKDDEIGNLAINMAVKAIERVREQEIPVKPVYKDSWLFGSRQRAIYCGNCGADLTYSPRSYCGCCGKAIDWKRRALS